MNSTKLSRRSSAPVIGMPVRWKILGILSLFGFLSYVFRNNLSVVLPELRTELELTDADLALVSSAFVWTYTLFQFPGGIWGQLLGSRRMLTLSAIAWTVIIALMGLLPRTVLASTGAILTGLVVLRFLMGAAQGPLMPVSGFVIYTWFPVGRWAVPNAVFFMVATLGFAAAGPGIAWLADHYGWEASFYLTAPLGLVVAALWWWYDRDDPAEHQSVQAQELALIQAHRTERPDDALPRGLLIKLLKNRQMLLLFGSYFCMNYVWYFFFAWLYLYLAEVRGFTLLESGFLGALPMLAGAGSAWLGGEICQRCSHRIGPRLGCRVPVMVGLIGAAVFLTAVVLTPDRYVAVAMLTLCYAFLTFTDCIYWQGTTYIAGRYTSSAGGVLNTGGNLAGILGTPLTALLFAQFGWTVALGAGVVFALLAATLWLFIRVDEPLTAGEETVTPNTDWTRRRAVS